MPIPLEAEERREVLLLFLPLLPHSLAAEEAETDDDNDGGELEHFASGLCLAAFELPSRTTRWAFTLLELELLLPPLLLAAAIKSHMMEALEARERTQKVIEWKRSGEEKVPKEFTLLKR